MKRIAAWTASDSSASLRNLNALVILVYKLFAGIESASESEEIFPLTSSPNVTISISSSSRLSSFADVKACFMAFARSMLPSFIAIDKDLSITIANRGSESEARIIDKTGSNKANRISDKAKARRKPSTKRLILPSGGFVT